MPINREKSGKGVHEPGDKIYVDFAGKKLKYHDIQNNQDIEVEFYAGLLGYSQLSFACVVPSQCSEDFLHASRRMLEYFGGTTRVIVTDNLKSGVTKASSYEPEIAQAFGMANLWQSLMETHQLSHLSNEQLLQMLLQAEWEHRQGKRQDRLVRSAHFRYQGSLEEIDWNANRNLDKSQILQLADCGFITRAENVLITGPTGVGKSFIASSIGHHACHLGYKVAYFNMQKLVQKLRVAKAEGTYIKEINRTYPVNLGVPSGH